MGSGEWEGHQKGVDGARCRGEVLALPALFPLEENTTVAPPTPPPPSSASKQTNTPTTHHEQRERRRDFILQHGLLNVRRMQGLETRRLPHEREQHAAMRVFAR